MDNSTTSGRKNADVRYLHNDMDDGKAFPGGQGEMGGAVSENAKTCPFRGQVFVMLNDADSYLMRRLSAA
ncbi:MAG TPA: hypothetical protein DCZ75_15365 [Geobacter sp.]|nr:hypothetical protein [Geobacter sp.]